VEPIEVVAGDADAAYKAACFEVMTSTVAKTLAPEVGEVVEVESEAGAERYSGKLRPRSSIE
jgi:hypothetical protein